MQSSNIHASFQSIINEIRLLAAPEARAARPASFPGLISVGQEGSILTNEKVEREIQGVADWLMEQRPAVKSQHSLKEWRANVRKAFGRAIAQLDGNSSLEEGAKALKQLVEQSIDEKSSTIAAIFTSMGCTLFDRPIDAPILIGPVRFETRLQWMDRAEQSGQITSDFRGRLQHALDGHPFKESPDTRESLLEDSILDVLRSTSLMCTVETNGLASDMSQRRAIVGARLAQTAIALLWRRPSGALDGFKLSVDNGHRQIKTILFVPGERWIGGSNLKGLPFGPYMPNDKWVALEKDARGFLDLAGKMIACWTSTPAYDQASPLLRNLAQAIHFFWEGCRDENDLMSIVKFTAALEALAQGKSAGIIKLVGARLGFKARDKIVDERTVKQIVELIYSTGRSRTLHGTNPDILHDWSDARSIAESLTRHCLVLSLDWVESNPSATDPKALLS